MKKHEAFYWKVKYGAFTPNDETKYMSSYDNEFHTGRNVIQGDQYTVKFKHFVNTFIPKHV